MKNKKHIILALTICLLTSSVLLSAVDLSSYIEAALEESQSSRIYELQRVVSTLQLERSELEQPEEDGVSLSAGNITLTYGEDEAGDHVVLLNPSATISFYDYDLTMTLIAPTTINTTDTTISGAPKVSIQKKIETYNPEDDTTLEDLESAAAQIDLDRNYYAGFISIEKNVLQIVKELITLDKTILITEKNISDAEEALENDQETGSIKEGSTTWKFRINSISRMKNSLASAQNSFTATLNNFRDYTGVEYEELTSEGILRPQISFKAPDMGNSIVFSAALDFEIAKQKLSDELFSRESSEISDSSFSYMLNGSYTAGLYPTGTYDHTLQAGVVASNSEFVIEAGISTIIDSNSIVPSAYITGRWADQADNQEDFDVLTLSILESQAATAKEIYNESYSGYLNDIQTMQLRISSWNISSVELDMGYEENMIQLKDADYAYINGFGTLSDVQDARHDLQKIEYDKMLNDIDGLLIERDIRILQL